MIASNGTFVRACRAYSCYFFRFEPDVNIFHALLKLLCNLTNDKEDDKDNEDDDKDPKQSMVKRNS